MKYIPVLFLFAIFSITLAIDPGCPYPSNVVTYLPDRANCSIFFECYQGHRTEFTCPPNTFWNQRKSVCDYVCDFGDDTTITPEPTWETTKYPVICPYPSHKLIYYPNRANCRTFFECYEGKRSEIACPTNLFWNQTAQACDYHCDFGDVSTTPAPKTTPSPLPDICKGKANGSFLSDPRNCRWFIECLNGQANLSICPEGTYWNEDALTCVGGSC